jgi:hypothetical protein
VFNFLKVEQAAGKMVAIEKYPRLALRSRE